MSFFKSPHISDIKMLVSLQSWIGRCGMAVKSSGFANTLLFWTYPPKCKAHIFFHIWISQKSGCSYTWWHLTIAASQVAVCHAACTSSNIKSSRTKLAENCGDNSGALFFPSGTKWLWGDRGYGGKSEMSSSVPEGGL